MLSIKNLASAKQASHYYEKDDYYVGGENISPSSWWGRGADHLGLLGPVDRATFTRLLDGELPDGTQLPRRPDKRRRPGFDLTFSAPKSVSLAALVLKDARVVSAHEEAVSRALAYLESKAALTRVKGDNDRIVTVESGNLLVARFLHDTSRDLDPQLHTHAVVLNATRSPNGSWRALTNEELLRSKMVGGAIYRAELAQRLVELGYKIDRTHRDGRFEIRGFDQEVLKAFSQRRARIEEELAERGLVSAKAAAIAAVETRDRKRRVDRRELDQIWQTRSRELGLDLKRVHREHRKRDVGVVARAADRAVESAIEHLSERKSVFHEREAIVASASFGLGKVGLTDIDGAIQRLREKEQLIDAKPRNEEHAKRYTTKDALLREHALIAITKLGQGTLEPIRAREDIDHALRNTRFTNGQKKAVRLVLSTEDRFVAIQGYAGTGKTTALNAIRAVAEREGFVVHGFATSAAAADVLREAGIQSITLAKHLLEVTGGGHTESSPSRDFPSSTVAATRELGPDGPYVSGRDSPDGRSSKPELWILDESSMLGTREALAFVRAAERLNARVVLVGDRAQLPAIEAGKPFALLVDRGLQTATLDEIQRQRNPELKKAIEATIAHDIDRALEILKPNIFEVTDRRERLAAVARAYLQKSEHDRNQTLVLTGSNEDRRTLNELIRVGLAKGGALSGSHVSSQVLVKNDLTRAERKSASSYAEGDVIRFGRPYAAIDVEKGEYLEVEKIRGDTNSVELRRRNGDIVFWNPARSAAIEIYAREQRAIRIGDRIRFTRNDKERGRINGSEGVIVAIQPKSNIVTLERGGRKELVDLSKEPHWDHAYVRTVYAAQGRTAEQAMIHIDLDEKQLNGFESFYVGASRARRTVVLYTSNADHLSSAIRQTMAKETAVDSADRVPQNERTF